MEMLEIMKKRHSVRSYDVRPIESEKRDILNALVSEINTEADLHIQIMYDEPKCFDSFMAHYGKFSGVTSYIALVGKKSSELEQKLGYYGEKLVLKAEELGLNTCWVAMTHGKSGAKTDKGEKTVCLISLGYGSVSGTPHKNKPLSAVCNVSADSPEWFIKGVEAALLAPTAMNQQKFFFELLPDGNVRASHGRGFYTKLDLGIASFHFEAISGKKLLK